MSKKKKLKKTTILLIFLDTIAVICLFLMYGPIPYFRNLWVTTAMTTKSHKYLARTFFNNDTINEMLANNYVSIDSITDTSAITIGDIKEPETFESVYEEQILKRDNNDLYKIIEIEGNNYKGYMAIIYDPTRISLTTAKYFGSGGQTIDKMIENEDAILGINASGFFTGGSGGSVPAGNVIKNGKALWDRGGVSTFIGFNKDHVLFLTKSTTKQAIEDGMIDAVEFGPFLIVNGEPAKVSGNGGWGIAPRTAIAQRKDGIVLFLVVDGRTSSSAGVDMKELINIFSKYKAYNAANLDGGGSSILYVNGEIINKGSQLRYLPTAFIVK